MKESLNKKHKVPDNLIQEQQTMVGYCLDEMCVVGFEKKFFFRLTTLAYYKTTQISRLLAVYTSLKMWVAWKNQDTY